MKRFWLGRPGGRIASAPPPAPPLGEGSYELSHLLVTLRGRGPGADHLNQLAAQLVARHFSLGRRGLALCGPSKGVGVSFMAANTAIALSRSGGSVLLIDANMAEPGVEAYLRPSRTPAGLADALRDRSRPIADLIHSDVLPNLSILYAGQADSARASDLLQTDALRSVMASCLRTFTCTIVDTPPANASAGARHVASMLGYALLIARSGVSYASDVATLTSELADDGTVVVGSVLNGG